MDLNHDGVINKIIAMKKDKANGKSMICYDFKIMLMNIAFTQMYLKMVIYRFWMWGF